MKKLLGILALSLLWGNIALAASASTSYAAKKSTMHAWTIGKK